MPKYKFQWSKLTSRLLVALCHDLGLAMDGESAAAALQTVYGARPKDAFIRDAWPTLLRAWLYNTKESRERIVDALREVRREDGRLTNRKAQMDYLRGLRNAKNLRSIVLREFIAFGGTERISQEPPHKGAKAPVPAKQPTEPPRPVEKPAPLPPGDDVTITADEPKTKSQPFTAAPGSVVLVRDAEWLVTSVEQATDGFFVHVIGLSELVRDTTATFSTAIDTVIEVDPAKVRVVRDSSPGFRRSRLWLEATLRKTPVAITDPELVIAGRGLANHLDYQFKAVRQALDPDKLRPRILLADAVGLGKTIEIGMILSELVRRGRGERILIVTPKHVLEQMQMELWTRFALPFVRLDSTGIQRIRQILPANRNPFTYYRRVIISIDTLKSDRYIAHLQKQWWDAVVVDFSSRIHAVRHVRQHGEMRLCHTPRRYCSRHPMRVTEYRPVEGGGCTRERWSTSSRPRTTRTIHRASRYSTPAPPRSTPAVTAG